jgi:hypothetical protein
MKLAFLAPLVGSASAAVIEHWWNISRALANPDGVRFHPLQFLLFANGSYSKDQ